MQTIEFLRLVTPESGDKVVVVPRGMNQQGLPRWYHAAFATHVKAAEFILASDELHIYYALGGFSSGEVSEWRGRSQANVVALRAFWLDIDVGANNTSKYATKAEAGAALGAFVDHYKLPSPLVVVSGGGLHVYWPLDSDVTRAEWKPVAIALKAATVAFKLLADPTRTADEASILRPVGTVNRKLGLQRLVRALPWLGAPVPLSTMVTALSVTTPSLPSLPKLAMPAMMQLNEAATVDTSTTKSAKTIISKCRQIGSALSRMRFSSGGVDPIRGDTGEPVSEPLWRAGVSVLVRCVNGTKHAHTFSSAYPEYNYDETQEKIERIGDKPSTCQSFEALRPGGCNGCAYYGKVKSPVVLGTQYLDIGAPELAMQSNVLLPVALAPHGFEVKAITDSLLGVPAAYPYKRTDAGIVITRSIPMVDPETGKAIPNKFISDEHLFCPYDIHPLFVAEAKINDMTNSQFLVMWRVVPKRDVALSRMFLLPKGDIASDDKLKAVLYATSAYSLDGENHKEVCRYMRHYMNQINDMHIQKQPMHFGWQQTDDLINGRVAVGDEPSNWNEQPMEFVTGNQVTYRRQDPQGNWVVGVGTICPSPNMAATAEAMQPRGVLEGWAKGAAFYTDAHTAEHIAAFLCATGSLFHRFSKNHGMVVSVEGEKGTGKTQLQNLAASVWGSPNEYVVGGTNTANAPEAIAAKFHSLPIIMDDKVGGTRESLIAELYLMANNNGKSRMDYSSGSPTAAPTLKWCTTVLISSNSSCLDIIASKAHDPSNEGAYGRIIEFRLNRVKATDWPISGTAGEHIYNNYIKANSGLIGPMLAQDYMADPARYNQKLLDYEELVKAEMRKRAANGVALWRQFCESESEYRLQLGNAACGLLSLYFLRRRRLVVWSPTIYIGCCVTAIGRTLQATLEGRPEKADVLAAYINEFQGNFIVVTSAGVQLGTEAEQVNFGKTPVSRVVGRIDQVENITWLDRGALKEWLSKKGVSESMFLSGLEKEGWAVGKGATERMTLGKGFPTLSKYQTRCIKLTRPNGE